MKVANSPPPLQLPCPPLQFLNSWIAVAIRICYCLSRRLEAITVSVPRQFMERFLLVFGFHHQRDVAYAGASIS
jgi:hypothetical protein